MFIKIHFDGNSVKTSNHWHDDEPAKNLNALA
jgi:hypothetical protein